MKNASRVLMILAVALCALTASSHAQTWAVVGAGSSAAALEIGEAEGNLLITNVSGTEYECIWTAAKGASTGISATDPTTGQAENGVSEVAYSIASDGTDCSAPGSTPTVESYLDTDSVVGNRLLFNSATAVLGGSPGTTAKEVFTNPCSSTGWNTTANPNTPVETCTLPSVISSLLQSPTVVNVAGTDVRPEDAAFATLRIGGTGCGVAVAGSQYLGLGYPFAVSGTPSTIKSYFSSGTFNVTNFTLPSQYGVYRLGAAPIVVHINQTDGTASGFADPGITNITSGELANFLDGTYSQSQDMQDATLTNQGVTVLLREPLSGTYNTMEYNDPNTVENKTSMDVGLTQIGAQQNCSGSGVKSNPLNIDTDLVGGIQGARQRVIGTGEMENVIFGAGTENNRPVGPILGWSFWSTPNFQTAYSGTAANYNTNTRYLTVDEIDPLMANYGPYPSTASPAASATVTSYASNGTTVTLTVANNTLTSGELVTFANMGTGLTGLDGLELPVLPAGLVSGAGGTFEVNSSAVSSAGSTASSGNVYAGGVCPGGVCPAGTIPTPNNGGLEGVTFRNVIDGSYPIWSFLRLVCSGASSAPSCVAASTLATSAQNYVHLGSAVDALHPPDFAPVTGTINTAWNSVVVRSHFVPPGITYGCTTANGTGPGSGSHAAPECGGDVGGVVYTIVGDKDYEKDFQGGLGVKQVGEIGHRR